MSTFRAIVVLLSVRGISILAVCAGVFALIEDLPVSTSLTGLVSRSVAEAVPLLLVGVAYLAWLATERPPIVALVKQILIAAAFLLWGVSLLMPTGPWARFVGAVVIAIYVFDLVWLIEGNLQSTLRNPVADQTLDGQAAGACGGGRWSGDVVGAYAKGVRSTQKGNTADTPR
jgi:hypothetical protein